MKLAWIDWNGEGPCPVPEGVGYCVRFRADDEARATERLSLALSGSWYRNRAIFDWSHEKRDYADQRWDIIAYALEPQTPSVDWQGAWLIEWPGEHGNPPRWWCPVKGWVGDANLACWFARREDAEGFKKHQRLHGRATEHRFLTMPTPSVDWQAVGPKLVEALRLFVEFHGEVFSLGRPLCIDGKPINHTKVNEAARLGSQALSLAQAQEVGK